jgi:hypothetical protein
MVSWLSCSAAGFTLSECIVLGVALRLLFITIVVIVWVSEPELRPRIDRKSLCLGDLY